MTEKKGFLARMFGGGGSAASVPVAAEEYEGFTITPQPKKADGGFRISAVIEKGAQRHELIRADVISDKAAADAASVAKARQLIDQMGERLFD